MSLKDQIISGTAILALSALGTATVSNTVTNGKQDVQIEQLTVGDQEILKELRAIRESFTETSIKVATLAVKEEERSGRPQ